jgi:demethylmenaquinone methyltransferase / 2-methoxy-6-polyprenyl-1,4-benzoquinol methylase
MTEFEAPVQGSRPAGVASEMEAAGKVREMFTQIAPRYDLLNHLLSLQLDRLWRARAARILKPILENPEALVLDLCCGTGDLAFALNHQAKARIIGADFAHTMLMRANEKAASTSALNGKSTIPFLEADALRLPFVDASLDLVAAAFGFRNLANYDAGLREILRVLKPGGMLAILEFTEPPKGVFGALYRWYFRNVLPCIGGIISGDRSAYRYLPESVAHFFRPEELAALMCACGFEDAQYRVWTFGTLALHTARRKV